MHGYKPENPLIVQSDKTVLLEVDNDQYADARDALARFAELEKSPEYVHTYRISPLSLWNAAAAGLSAQRILGDLERYSKYPLPDNIRIDIADSISRYGRLKIVLQNGQMLVASDDHALMEELSRHKLFSPLIVARPNPLTFQIDPAQRGHVKRILVQIGFPAEDLAGYEDGESLPFHLTGLSNFTGAPWDLRNYQSEAADIFWSRGESAGGAGVIVLPCGAGKTIVGMAAMAHVQAATLILSPNTVAVRQWIREILDKTSLTEEQVGEYTGLRKEIRPVTVTTYQVLTYRPRKNKTAAPGAGDGAPADEDRPDGLSQKSRFRPIKLAEYPHMQLFTSLNWGLVIYDEVHLLPAPVFRMTAEIQARRRLGLTATLVREDGAEGDVFSLVGPKKYDVPWKELEKQGWIATAECHEVRVSLEEEDRMEYAVIGEDEKYRYAATNRKKLDALAIIADKHKEDSTLIIGQYLSQLDQVAKRLDAPLITGETPVKQREELYNKFRTGEITRLVLSKVGNFSVDLPDANVMIQVSGMFGSRQEEAQRLGRVLRPKRNGLLAHFYSITTRDTLDQEFAAKRQLFLTEQGYHYDIFFEDEIAAYQPPILAANAAPVRRNAVGLLT